MYPIIADDKFHLEESIRNNRKFLLRLQDFVVLFLLGSCASPERGKSSALPLDSRGLSSYPARMSPERGNETKRARRIRSIRVERTYRSSPEASVTELPTIASVTADATRLFEAVRKDARIFDSRIRF